MWPDVAAALRPDLVDGTICPMTPVSPRTSPRVDRRTLLRYLGLLGAGAAVAACSPAQSSAGGSAPSPSAPADPGSAAVRMVAPDADPSLAVVAATFEQLIDQPNPFAFGVFTLEQEPVEGAAVTLHVVDADGTVAGQWPATAVAEQVPPGGLYTAPATFADVGLHEMVAVTEDGRAGVVAIDVRSTETSQLPAPGQLAQAVATPTTADALGYERLCTRTPEPCGMHEVSLETALVGGGPVALLFATPAFCQTAVCGPSVDVVDRVREDGLDDVTFIHCEIYSDAGETLGDPVSAWNLPTEPWLYTIGAAGDIVGRADGPLLVIRDEVASLVAAARTV